MNNKILSGSIITVTILIGVSFTSVVGYRSVESDVKASPLFNIRSSRAIDEESEDLSCEYVGKGEEILLSIPKRVDKIKLVQKFIGIIIKMNDKTYNRFIASLVSHLKNNGYSNIEEEEIVTGLNELRVYVGGNNILWENREKPQYYTEYFDKCTFNNWKVGCLAYKIYVVLYAIGWITFTIFFWTLLAVSVLLRCDINFETIICPMN